MRFSRSIMAWGAALLLAGSGWTLVAGADAPLAEPMTSRDIAGIAGGDCVTDGTTNCPAQTNACDTACNGKAAGVACAGKDYRQINANYPTVKKADSGGVKASKPAATATLCGSDRGCGPACVNVAMGGPTTCTVATSADYKVGTIPDPDSGACDEESRLERLAPPIERTILFATNGGLFQAFR